MARTYQQTGSEFIRHAIKSLTRELKLVERKYTIEVLFALDAV